MHATPSLDSPAPRRALFSPARLLFVVLLSALGFCLPQETPLEWYPLNQPGPDLNYLEITCAADRPGEVRINYALARDGHRPLDTIRWPVSATTGAYTYTFPLPDAPITEMQVGPPAGGALTIRQMRIINRRGEEIRRFPRDLFHPQEGLAEIVPLPDGWKLVSAPDAANPSARLELFTSIAAAGRDQRNLLRCVRSTGYLALMLSFLLLAVGWGFYPPAGWRDALKSAAFVAVCALCLALAGNRGLIRNSLRYARYVPPVPSPGLTLEIDVASSFRVPAQLFWDTGAGMDEKSSTRAAYEPHDGLQTLRFALPATPVTALRLDPGDSAGAWTVRGLRLVDHGQRTRLTLPLTSVVAGRDIDRFWIENERLHLVTYRDSTDPITGFQPEAIAAINRLLAPPARP